MIATVRRTIDSVHPYVLGMLVALAVVALLAPWATAQGVPDGGAAAAPVVVKPAVLIADPELPPPADDYEAKGRAVLQAVDKGDGWMAAALALSLLVLAARHGAGRFLPDGPAAGETSAWKTRAGIVKRWIASGEGAVVLTVVGAVSSGVVSTLTAGVAPWSWLGIKAVIKVAVAALGGFAGIQHTFGSKAADARAERREITGAIKAGAVPAPSAP